MKIKIKRLKDLNRVENENYSLIVMDSINMIYVHSLFYERIAGTIYYDTNDEILSVLKSYGFDVEFDNDVKLTKAEWHMLNYLKIQHKMKYLCRNKDSSIFAFTKKPTKTNEKWTGSLCYSIYFELFPVVKWEDSKIYNINEMLTWEVED